MLRSLTLFSLLIHLAAANAQGLGLSSSIMHATCGSSTGSISTYAYGGSWPFRYLWSNGATPRGLQNVPVG
ncbi:MAG: hypothetical protein JNM91_09710, partial [Flavobacteriales bacterium]|nr:hypothetical protein [Flavobacteriales bacterium]